MPTLELNLPSGTCPITVAPGALDDIGAITRNVAAHDRAMLVVDQNVAADHGARAHASLTASGFDVTVAELVATEDRKTLEVVRHLYELMLASRLERGSPLVAVGGGIVGDVAGFAAASYLRGVPLVQVPTTLLAMVDAAIGGKTGVNFPLPGGVLGKNLIGAFWQPRAVITDPHTLRTLDPRHLRCGFAETVKHAIIADAPLFDDLEAGVETMLAGDPGALGEVILRSAFVKVAVVAEDEREAGRRALLNLGHTFGHVIEPIADLDLHHGEAVAIGIIAATECAHARQLIPDDDAKRIRNLVAACGLPDALPQKIAHEPLVEAMAFDKKVAGDRIRLVVPVVIGAARMIDDVTPAELADAWRSVGAA